MSGETKSHPFKKAYARHLPNKSFGCIIFRNGRYEAHYPVTERTVGAAIAYRAKLMNKPGDAGELTRQCNRAGLLNKICAVARKDSARKEWVKENC